MEEDPGRGGDLQGRPACVGDARATVGRQAAQHPGVLHEHKRENEIDPIWLRPLPHEFAVHYDI
jgi:hypothetical protein